MAIVLDKKALTTVAAVPFCLFMIVIGEIIGWVPVMLYGYFFGSIIEHSWLPNLINNAALEFFPSMVRGMIAGAIAFYVTVKMFKHSDIVLIAYATIATYISFLAFFFVSVTVLNGTVSNSPVKIIGGAIGVCGALYFCALEYKGRSK